MAIGLQNLGMALYESGRFAEAEPPTARSLALLRKLFGDDSARTAALLLNHCEVLTALRRFDEARADIVQALAIWRKQNANPFFIGMGLLDRGRLELEAGDPKAARATLLEAGRVLAKDHPPLSAEVDFALARTFWAVPADRGKAVPLARQARAVLATTGDGARKVAEIDAWLAAHAGGD